MRSWLEQVEVTAEGDDALAVLAWLAGANVQVDEDELRGAMRRSLLLLAAGGDPHRSLEPRRPRGRAPQAADRPERRDELARGLAGLRADSEGLPGGQLGTRRPSTTATWPGLRTPPA